MLLLVSVRQGEDALTAYFLAQAASKQMIRWQRGGAILLYASIAGDSVQRSAPNQFHAWSTYATSKAAVQQITRSFSVELAKQGIRVNSLSPGQLKTPCVAAGSLLLSLDACTQNDGAVHWRQQGSIRALDQQQQSNGSIRSHR